MATFILLIMVGLGSLCTLAGLLLIAPEVRIHQIKVNSRGSALFRAGMLLVAAGIGIGLAYELPGEFAQVGQLMGVAGIMGGVITAGHEWKQAHEQGQPRWDWPRSLTLQMIILGIVVLVVASVAAQ